MAPQIAVKRAYEPPAKEDGHRFLVDRMWPRGVKKEALHVQVGGQRGLEGLLHRTGRGCQGAGAGAALCG